MLLPLELKIPEFSNPIIWTPKILEVPTQSILGSVMPIPCTI